MKSAMKIFAGLTFALLTLAVVTVLVIKYFNVIAGVFDELKSRMPQKRCSPWSAAQDACCADFQPNMAGEDDF